MYLPEIKQQSQPALKPLNAPTIKHFLASCTIPVQQHAALLRQVILRQLPGISEQLDLPAKMIAYSYGPGYAGLVRALLPSKKGLKLGFNKGPELSQNS
ncbi:hypothetical protein [Niabella sp.]|uniref:hypothetical protein n=1 Tax=Niabella sp. TaxID=1962976 RepID=UPI0026203E48|nr:hypothetical protein [Niabella sp.]